MTHSQITSFLWSITDLIRDTFKRGNYQDVILPLTVLRRIDQVLEPTKEKVLKTYSEFKGKLDNPDDLLRKASGYAFYNTSLYTFERLVDDPQNIAHNLRTYVQSFSPNMRDVIEKFAFDNTIAKLDDAGLLFQRSPSARPTSSSRATTPTLTHPLRQHSRRRPPCRPRDGLYDSRAERAAGLYIPSPVGVNLQRAAPPNGGPRVAAIPARGVTHRTITGLPELGNQGVCI